MSTRLPPRHLPTLTEVVNPRVREALSRSTLQTTPVAQVGHVNLNSAPVVVALPDRETLARQVIELVTPQLESELRSVAQELFEAQYSAMLPSLHLQIEHAVREAIELALPDRGDQGN
jgi:hypothetical protein